jgi:hypothetical protein
MHRMTSPGDVLSQRAVNRATLARQFLLERATTGVADTIEHLVGMQAQAPNAPYVALWSRLAGFDPAELARLLLERRAVRGWFQRGTVHLVTARDAVGLRALVQPVAARTFAGSPFSRDVAGLDLAELVSTGQTLLAATPRTRAELGRLLAGRYPGRDGLSLAFAVNMLVPMVQVPPRGIWGVTGPAALTPLSSWLGVPLDVEPSIDDLVLRYLGAFGPATVKDAQTWSGLTRLREVVERLRPKLRAFRDETGAELFDLPEAPRPHPDTPAPPRFLPEYDNLLLSHADRTRVVPDGRAVPLPPGNGANTGTLLVDGTFRATWTITRDDEGSGSARVGRGGAGIFGGVTLSVEPFVRLSRREAADVTEEGARLLGFTDPDTKADVRIGSGSSAS